MMTRWKLRAAGWSLALSSALGASCGAAFHTGVDDGEGGEPAAAEGGAGPAAGGGSSTSAAAGGAGGATSEAGAAGAGSDDGALTCEQLGGEQREGGSCYVDVTTTTSPTQPEALAACEALARELGRPAHLLVLNDLAEQDFVLRRLLAEFTNVNDAWLGLTCTEQAHPEVDDCFCQECEDPLLAQKQQAWSWLDGTSASFGWVNGNPNAAARCAALAYNPTPGIKDTWGWVERPCDQAMVTPVAGNPHGYRALCEVQL